MHAQNSIREGAPAFDAADSERSEWPPAPPIVANVPAALRERPQFVVWRWERKPGAKPDEKPTKVPYDPKPRGSGRSSRRGKASTTNPATWGTFEQAMAALDAGAGHGIGFVFSAADPYVGIDLDGCCDPDSGAIAPWAVEVIERFDSYTEVSPSGRGVHVIVACTAPLPPGNRRGPIEVYQSGRYFTMTGDVLDAKRAGERAAIADKTADLLEWHGEVFGQPDPVPIVPARVDPPPLALSDQAVLDKAFGAANGETIRRLYAGDTGAHDGDDSRATAALLAHLCFYAADDAQLDRLFRRSGLMRPKWDEKRGTTTWGAHEIAFCRSTQRNAYDRAFRPPPVAAPLPDAEADDSLPDDPAELKRLVLAERGRAADLRRRLDAERARARREDAIRQNTNLRPVDRLAAVGLLREVVAGVRNAGRPWDAETRVNQTSVAPVAGVSPDSFRDALTLITAAGLIETRTEPGELVPRHDPRRGRTVLRPSARTYVRLRVPPDDAYRAVAALDGAEYGRRPIGKRDPRGRPTCAACGPGVAVRVRTETTVCCTGCGSILAQEVAVRDDLAPLLLPSMAAVENGDVRGATPANGGSSEGGRDDHARTPNADPDPAPYGRRDPAATPRVSDDSDGSESDAGPLAARVRLLARPAVPR